MPPIASTASRTAASPIRRRFGLFVAILAVLAMVGACGGDRGGSGSAIAASRATTTGRGASTTPEPPVTGEITVFAAASLTAAFDDVGAAFSRANPDAEVTFSYDASSALAQQIAQGAPADVFASADTANMDKLTRAGLAAAPPQTFATNVLTVVVPRGNPQGITGLADLAEPGLKVVLCADGVPCGTYARQILSAANLKVTPVSLEQNVKGVVTKVTTGEADAGIVYVTDVAAAGKAAEAVAIPRDLNVVANYPVVTVQGAKNRAAADAFVAFLLGADGQAILARYGFGAP